MAIPFPDLIPPPLALRENLQQTYVAVRENMLQDVWTKSGVEKVCLIRNSTFEEFVEDISKWGDFALDLMRVG